MGKDCVKELGYASGLRCGGAGRVKPLQAVSAGLISLFAAAVLTATFPGTQA